MDNQLLNTLIGIGSVIAGAGIRQLVLIWQNRQRFKVMTFDRRLSAHQEALSQIQILRHVIEDKDNTDKDPAIKNFITWIENNELLLDKKSRLYMRSLEQAAWDHIYDDKVKQTVFSRISRETYKALFAGIGQQHITPTKPQELFSEKDYYNS